MDFEQWKLYISIITELVECLQDEDELREYRPELYDKLVEEGFLEKS